MFVIKDIIIIILNNGWRPMYLLIEVYVIQEVHCILKACRIGGFGNETTCTTIDMIVPSYKLS